MQFKLYNSTELFQILDTESKKKKGRKKNYEYPFDFEFKKRKEAFNKDNKRKFHGSGIYLITFNDSDEYNKEIIYIGKYMPHDKGNVITDRWIKHIATFTNRGHKLGGFGKERTRNKKNTKYLILEKLENEDKKINDIIQRIKKEGRTQDTGCSTSVKRLEFAYKYWGTFKVDKPDFKEKVLPKFQFYYMQLNGYRKDAIPVLQGNPISVKEYYENLASLIETYLLLSLIHISEPTRR